jgi:hypothetical protein
LGSGCFNLGQATNYPEAFMIFLSLPSTSQDDTLNQNITTLYHVLSISLFAVIQTFDALIAVKQLLKGD